MDNIEMTDKDQPGHQGQSGQPGNSAPQGYPAGQYGPPGQPPPPGYGYPGPYGHPGQPIPPGYPAGQYGPPGQPVPPGYGYPGPYVQPGQPVPPGYPGQYGPAGPYAGQKVPPVTFAPMPHPGAMPGVPAGLEYLASVDQLMIYQDIHLLEVVTGIECANKYRILNNMQQQVYSVYEEPASLFQLQCCGPNRGFKLHITDNFQQDIMILERTFRCCAGCCWCADQDCCIYPINVLDKSGEKLGMVRTMNSFWKSHFGIFDANDELLYDMWAPCCPCQGPCCEQDIDFPVRNAKDGSQAGNIAKVWAGMQELVTNADTYSVRFPIDFDVKHKALMIATVFLIDFSIFERQKKNNNRHH